MSNEEELRIKACNMLTKENIFSILKLTEKVNAAFVVTNVECVNAEKRLYRANFFNTETQDFEPRCFFMPSVLKTRLEKMGLINDKDSLILIKYIGMKKSNLNRMMHQFYIETQPA